MATSELTARERDVLQLVTEGLYDKEIALELGIAIETVKKHNYRIRQKLGVRNRVETVLRAILTRPV